MENTNILNQLIPTLYAIITIIGAWKMFVKMGYAGWKSIIPFYNGYITFEELYGNGWRFLTLLIPVYHLYVYFKMHIDWANSFGKGTAFGVLMAIFPAGAFPVLGFGNAEYQKPED